MTIIRNTNKTAKNGNAARTTDIIGIFATPEVTKRLSPTGGVIMPISIFTTIMIPRCIGSIPSSIAIGKTRGATITSNPEGSINCPPISKITLTITKNMIGPNPADSIAEAICCGICSSVKTCFKISAFAMMNINVTVSLPDSNNVFRVSL